MLEPALILTLAGWLVACGFAIAWRRAVGRARVAEDQVTAVRVLRSGARRG